MCRYLYKTGQSLEYNPDFVARAGDLVLARASDGYWYRAVVADSANPVTVTVTVTCPDFGFSETVSLENIREINVSGVAAFSNNKFLGGDDL